MSFSLECARSTVRVRRSLNVLIVVQPLWCIDQIAGYDCIDVRRVGTEVPDSDGYTCAGIGVESRRSAKGVQPNGPIRGCKRQRERMTVCDRLSHRSPDGGAYNDVIRAADAP